MLLWKRFGVAVLGYGHQLLGRVRRDRFGLPALRLYVRFLCVREGHAEQGLGATHELVDVAFARHFLHDALLVVVAQGAAQLVVVHGGPVLLYAPAARYLLRVDELELHAAARPRDERRALRLIQQRHQELPELQRAAPLERPALGVAHPARQLEADGACRNTKRRWHMNG